MAENTHKYDDIIHLPRPKSERHAPMSLIDRGAQFSPFAALVGYGAVIEETARLTDAFTELDESGKELLDRKLRYIAEDLERAGSISFRCFVPDEWKAGGSFVTYTGVVKKIDLYRQSVVLRDGTQFWIDSIRAIDGIEEDIL